MKIKGLVSLFIGLALLLCTACDGITFTARTQNTTSVKNTVQSTTETAAPSATETTGTTETEPTAFPMSAANQRALYEEYLTEQVRNAVEYDYMARYYVDYIEEKPGSPGEYQYKYKYETYTYGDDAKKLQKPPQLGLASRFYDYYDVDRDGQQELIWLNYKNYVTGMATIREGEVKSVPINEYNDRFSFASRSDLTLMKDGTLCSDVGFGHVPGFQLLSLREDGAYYVERVLTPPCNAAMFSQSDYEDGGESITEEEYDRLISELKKSAVPVKLKPKSLLTFWYEHSLSLKWLNKASDNIVSVSSPKASPQPQVKDLQGSLDWALRDRQKSYQWAIEYPKKPDSGYDAKTPAKRYYALYDLDGNGAEEIFTGEETENGKIRILTCWYLLPDGGRNDVWNEWDEYPQFVKEIRVLSGGWIVEEYVIAEGNVSNSLLKYRSISVADMSLWRYGDEAALYYYDDGDKRLSLTPKAYERQRAEIEKGGKTVDLDWKPLEDYGK